MKYKELYETTIWNIMELVGSYRTYIENDDLNNLYKTKQLLVGEKAKLNQICSDANGFYLEKKSELSDKKDELYLMYCETDTNGVAERKSRLDTKDLRDDCNRLKTQRNKSGKLLEDVNSIIIEIAIILKDKKNQETYG